MPRNIPQGGKVYVPRGSTEIIRVVFRETDGSAKNLADHIAHFVVGSASDGTKELFRLRSDVAEEATVYASAGYIDFKCAGANTEELSQGSYWHDTWLRRPSGEVKQWYAPDRFEVGPRVPNDPAVEATA